MLIIPDALKTNHLALLLLQIVLSGFLANSLRADDLNSVYGSYADSTIVITDPRLKIVTLNIAHGRKDAMNQIFLGKTTIQQNLRDIGSNLKRYSPHVVSLQEADAPSLWSGRFDHVRYLAEHSGLPYHASARHSSTPIFRFGTAFISTVPMEDVHSASFSPSPPTLRKGFITASIPWNPGGRLAKPIRVSLVSVHLDFSRESVRKKQTRELVDFLEALPRPLVLCGDLNSEWTGDDPTVRNIAHSLSLRVHQPHSNLFGTYPANGKRLDWILISSDLKFVDYEIVSEVMSDHLAVIARIGIE
jgi:endonuclease/exonuclease/phosphatase family metal-dependent hydrolase